MPELTRKQLVDMYMKMGMTREYAEFVIDMVQGNTQGDIVTIDAQGKEAPHEYSKRNGR